MTDHCNHAKSVKTFAEGLRLPNLWVLVNYSPSHEEVSVFAEVYACYYRMLYIPVPIRYCSRRRNFFGRNHRSFTYCLLIRKACSKGIQVGALCNHEFCFNTLKPCSMYNSLLCCISAVTSLVSEASDTTVCANYHWLFTIPTFTCCWN